MDMKEQIVGWVHRIDQLKTETEKLWSKVQQSVAAGHVDDTITLLNAYFNTQEQLSGIEAELKSMLHSYFPDK
jgi:hypothetical protein